MEQHGKEGALSDAYREKMHELHSKDAQYVLSWMGSAFVFELYLRYHEFDFHAECRGMRYENISKLVCQVGRTFEKQGYISHTEGYAHPLTVALQILLGVRLSRDVSTERRLPR